MRKRDGVIEISGATYSMKYVKDLTGKDGGGIWGWYKPQTGEILIDIDQPAVASRNTLIHEIVHGIMEHAGFGGHPDDERIASAIAYGLESVKVNGKKLLR